MTGEAGGASCAATGAASASSAAAVIVRSIMSIPPSPVSARPDPLRDRGYWQTGKGVEPQPFLFTLSAIRASCSGVASV
ncbi:hypothetical protein GCM10011380_13680 [Sphingomonas metalli]|uniref:Uncharacterized protein n=1 Tax=Sphingomonas metalli TaxID=1779358 RepID=A0A916WS48_9SPHN|nr:hypothetical protein GCM10011380_13680 [Sphingomonas metalli]